MLFLLNRCNEGMTNNYYTYLTNTTSNVIHKPIYSQDELIEITTLPLCKTKVDVSYSNNKNAITNDNISIGQDIINPMIQTAELDGKNYNLVRVEFKKSQFSWNGKPIGLNLHLVHNTYNSTLNNSIVLPIDLTSDDNQTLIETFKNQSQVETFKNIFYKKMDNAIKYIEPTFAEVTDVINKDKYFNLDNTIANIQNSFSDIGESVGNITKEKGKFNLLLKYKRKYDIKNVSINNLLNNKNQIPKYQCCKQSIGPVVDFNLCLLQKIIMEMPNIYVLDEENGNKLLITEPIPFNEDIGLYIRDLIVEDPNIVYLK